MVTVTEVADRIYHIKGENKTPDTRDQTQGLSIKRIGVMACQCQCTENLVFR